MKIAYSAYIVTNVLQCGHYDNCVVCTLKKLCTVRRYIVKIVLSVLCENCVQFALRENCEQCVHCVHCASCVDVMAM